MYVTQIIYAIELAIIAIFIGLTMYRLETAELSEIRIQSWSENFTIELINKFLLFGIFFVLSLSPFKLLPTHRSISNPLIWLATTAAALLTLDLIFYFRHRIYHRYFWRFHKLHHNDEGYDLTLAYRMHPFETVIHLAIFLVLATAFHLDQWQLLIVSQIFSIQAILSHFEGGRLRTEGEDNASRLSRIFILAKDHKHHHSKTDFDCNYGFLFSFWDRIFKTQKRTAECLTS